VEESVRKYKNCVTQKTLCGITEKKERILCGFFFLPHQGQSVWKNLTEEISAV
jgi:hypothetical protein